jgi:general secretion pathway protein C
MKTMLFIFVACAALLVAATATHSLTPGGESGTNALPEISSSSPDADGSAEVTAEFRLLGIVFTNRPGQNLAVIETGADRHQRFIHEGDSIGELTVKKILSNQVVFETDQGERIARLNGIYPDNNNAGGTVLSEQTKTNSLSASLGRKQTLEVDRKELSSSLADIDKTIQDVKISPVKVYGRPVGVRISPVERGSVFADLGLKTGDIITAVNGEEIRNPEEAIALLERIRDGGEFDINIKGSRRSRKLELVVK